MAPFSYFSQFILKDLYKNKILILSISSILWSEGTDLSSLT